MICNCKTWIKRIESGNALSEIDRFQIENFLRFTCPNKQKLSKLYSELIVNKYNEEQSIKDPTTSEETRKASKRRWSLTKK